MIYLCTDFDLKTTTDVAIAIGTVGATFVALGFGVRDTIRERRRRRRQRDVVLAMLKPRLINAAMEIVAIANRAKAWSVGGNVPEMEQFKMLLEPSKLDIPGEILAQLPSVEGESIQAIAAFTTKLALYRAAWLNCDNLPIDRPDVLHAICKMFCNMHLDELKELALSAVPELVEEATKIENQVRQMSLDKK